MLTNSQYGDRISLQNNRKEVANMKLGTTVKVTASYPEIGQEGVEKIIGNTYKVVGHWKQKTQSLETGEVIIESPEFGGEVILSQKEYEIIG